MNIDAIVKRSRKVSEPYCITWFTPVVVASAFFPGIRRKEKSMQKQNVVAVVALVMCWLLSVSCPTRAADKYTANQLQQMVAPIALYPDSLLSQILMASAYPLEIVQADRWVKANAKLSDAERTKALGQQKWDPAVTSLTAFPDVLSRLSENLDWTQALGEAFLAQKDDLFGAIQVMRAKAQTAGNLQNTSQMDVTADANNNITITPAETQVVYVPQYNPTVVYGSTWTDTSWYWPTVMAPPAGYVAGTALAFGTGVVAGAAMFGGVNWYNRSAWVGSNYWHYPAYHGGVNYNNVYNNFNRAGQTNWQYNNYHRGNVNFQNNNLQQRYNANVNNGNIRGFNNNTINRGNTFNFNSGNTNLNRGNTSVNRQGSNSMPGSRSVPYTRPGNASTLPSNASSRGFSGAGATRSTPFGSYGSGSFESRASQRGQFSSGRQGGGLSGSSGFSRPVNSGGFRGGARRR